MSEAFDSLLTVTVRPLAGDPCVVPAGEFDLASSGLIEREVETLLEDGCATVVLDLRELAFIDSSGVHELLRCHDAARARDAGLTLVIADGPVRRALELCGVIGRFDVELSRPL